MKQQHTKKYANLFSGMRVGYIETDKKENAISSSVLLTIILRWLIQTTKQ